MKQLHLVVLGLTATACQYHWSASTGTTSSHAVSDPAPASEVSKADDAPSPRPDHEPSAGIDAEPLPSFEWAAKASRAWDGSYGVYPVGGTCASSPYKVDGPDTQVVYSDAEDTSGFVCPGTCLNPAPVVVKNGIATVPLVWLEVDKDVKRGFKFTYHRVIDQIQLASRKGVTAEAVAAVGAHAAPKHTIDVGDTAFTVDEIAISVALVNNNSDADGHGRSGAVAIHVGHDDKFLFDDDIADGCRAALALASFKPPPDGDGDGDGDGNSSSGSSGGHEDHSAQRKCKAQCRSTAGECRKSCHGQSASCAQECGHEESSCSSSC